MRSYSIDILSIVESIGELLERDSISIALLTNLLNQYIYQGGPQALQQM